MLVVSIPLISAYHLPSTLLICSFFSRVGLFQRPRTQALMPNPPLLVHAELTIHTSLLPVTHSFTFVSSTTSLGFMTSPISSATTQNAARTSCLPELANFPPPSPPPTAAACVEPAYGTKKTNSRPPRRLNGLVYQSSGNPSFFCGSTAIPSLPAATILPAQHSITYLHGNRH